MADESSENVRQPKLTKTEERILEVLLDPSNRFKSTLELCDMVGCATKTYYRATAKPHFKAELKQRSMETVERHIGQVVNTFVREATAGSFPHGKVLLEMAGLYQEKGKIEHSGSVTLPIALALSKARERAIRMRGALKTDAGAGD